jgi:hypothetical protein
VEVLEDSEIIKLLEGEFDVSARQIQELLAGLKDAQNYHQDMGQMYCSQISIKDYKGTIQKAHDALKNLNTALGNLSDMDKLIIDDYYREANDSDALMIDLANEVMFKTGEPQSGFQQLSQRMQAALKIAEYNIRAPGAGGASRTGKEYIAAIEMLARWFSDAFPDYKVSATPNTPFYKYTQLWFQLFVDPDENDKDIRRHIANTLKHPHVRLQHDKSSN